MSIENETVTVKLIESKGENRVGSLLNILRCVHLEFQFVISLRQSTSDGVTISQPLNARISYRLGDAFYREFAGDRLVRNFTD